MIFEYCDQARWFDHATVALVIDAYWIQVLLLPQGTVRFATLAYWARIRLLPQDIKAFATFAYKESALFMIVEMVRDLTWDTVVPSGLSAVTRQ